MIEFVGLSTTVGVLIFETLPSAQTEELGDVNLVWRTRNLLGF